MGSHSGQSQRIIHLVGDKAEGEGGGGGGGVEMGKEIGFINWKLAVVQSILSIRIHPSVHPDLAC